ncbi:PH domain-containing protein [Neobacillus sp. PS3-34]|uniref:PH domain-containing protein n=1 Tax=Neobacillus sp. PS3-34 TaxID=3070678 RepID=UPI0027DEB400|nr:PH domain-containing protein [Neobacillus sp. PS3-34]WML46643.1 PH domain-containing protein [Neobacillus sp. PS3-34]
MVFRSKIDTYFKTFISIIILLISAVTLIPLFLDEEVTPLTMMIVFFIFIISVGLILWSAFSIKYIFYQDHLFVRGGPFRSRIPYEEITRISPAKEILTGYRLLSSKESFEIFYKSATLGSVKISPMEIERFISEIKQRCPNVTIQE